MKIGSKIRELRKERKMTLQELSKKSGVALATLSRIENEIMTGTIGSHMQICKAMDITLPELYAKIEEGKKQVEHKSVASRTDIFVHSKKSSSEMLTSRVMDKKMMPIMIKIDFGGSTHKEETKRGIEKFIYVIDGKIEALVGKEKYNLNKSETLYFDASLPHVLKNSGTGEAKVICVISPPAL
ncbi:MAG: hypothetical protein COS99_05255 [Candidatus Omnitrophica bacterium CG07_land_8_20_14_0_80_42_15]|uniref:HTH cro/C1-type domain-containing protein n=1 Tax=Candidatus Aquitaenariimonas noxiae TaxID=1974741 RepID=A0A2J0KUL2_9BACT|nr:MAG: hypothetical protein COS99_05255 [Candidatus Omnitrophica bacterium CG07_land_8_20_14_0_80_42_15]